MATMNISLPEHLREYVDEQVRRKYGTTSEYVRDLIRKDREREVLKALLVTGAESELTEPVDADYFAGLKRHARKSVKR